MFCPPSDFSFLLSAPQRSQKLRRNSDVTHLACRPYRAAAPCGRPRTPRRRARCTHMLSQLPTLKQTRAPGGRSSASSASRPERGAGTQRSRASTRREVTKRQHKIIRPACGSALQEQSMAREFVYTLYKLRARALRWRSLSPSTLGSYRPGAFRARFERSAVSAPMP